MIGTLIICATPAAVDGDTIKCNGINMRDMGDGAPFVSGYDAPEIWHRHCQAELDLARKARNRMRELVATPGVQVIDSGQVDETPGHRPPGVGAVARWPLGRECAGVRRARCRGAPAGIRRHVVLTGICLE